MKKHKIKSYKETFYKVVKKNGEIQKGNIVENSIPLTPSSTKIVFNKHGKKIEETWFNTNEGLLLKNTYKYDRKRNIIEQNGILEKKFSYKYDNKGNKIEQTAYKFDGGLYYKITYTFDARGNKTEENIYNSNEILESKRTYKYDERENMIEEKWYYNGNLISYYRFIYDEKGKMKELNDTKDKYVYTYKYDKKGNWIEKIEYINDIPKTITEREIEYYP